MNTQFLTTVEILLGSVTLLCLFYTRLSGKQCENQWDESFQWSRLIRDLLKRSALRPIDTHILQRRGS